MPQTKGTKNLKNMGRNLRPKCRLCRRAGQKLFLKGEKCFTTKCPIVTRNFPPGMHGPTQGDASKRKMTDFGKQMREKQKAKAIYFLLERQFRGYVDAATHLSGDTAVNLQRMLEMRLDNVVFRLGFAQGRAGARQLVTHGAITVNGKKITSPSLQVSPNDVIGFVAFPKNQERASALMQRLQKMNLPRWLTFMSETQEGKITGIPDAKEFEGSFNAGQIIEFYSR